MSKKLYALIIMDGFAFAKDKNVSAIDRADTPNISSLMQKYKYTKLSASGLDVGLPDGQMGNSEVGHLNMGAGRIVYQELTRITKSIKDGDFYTNKELVSAVDHVKKTGGKLHFMGLLSDGGVHSHINHLYALLKLAKKSGIDNAYIHCFLDGRDVSPTSGQQYVNDLYDYTVNEKFGKIASVCGRYYAMDRDNRWDRVEQAYLMLTKGSGEKALNPYEAVKKSYIDGVTDEFVKPINIIENGKPVATIENGDAVIFFNFRPDRAREITYAFTEDDFTGFSREKIQNLCYVCFTQYNITFKNVSVAYKPQNLSNTLGEYISGKGYKQLRIAETEKYAHVTFFFNGGVEAANEGEDRVLIPSPKVATYDLKPEMSAFEVTEKVIEAISSNKYDLMILNFANCDMVGHTGIMEAAEKAVTVVDTCVGKVVSEILKSGGVAIITADHGNADCMIDGSGNPFTAHTTSPVPFILADDTRKNVKLKSGGKLADIAPTLLYMMGINIPKEMTGKILIEE